MQMMYQFGGNYFQVISHFLSFCQIFVNYSKHFLNPWHSLTYFAEPCCAFPHLEIPWLVYLAVYWHTLIHPDTTWLSLPSLAQAYQTLPAMEKWLRRPYTMTSTSHPNKNITNYFFISESPFPCWLLMDITAVNCLPHNSSWTWIQASICSSSPASHMYPLNSGTKLGRILVLESIQDCLLQGQAQMDQRVVFRFSTLGLRSKKTSFVFWGLVGLKVLINF